MKLLDVVREVRRHLEENGRVSLRMLRRQYELDDEALDELIEELVDVQRVARREENVLVWSGGEKQGVTGLGGYGVTGSGSRTLTPNPISETRKVISIVFADLVGSTALQERLDPESVNRVMDAYYQAVRGPVEAAGGTVVQLLGDGVLCAFGIPQIAQDDALRAVRAAVGIQQAFREFLHTQQWLRVPIGLRVAVNTGEVVVSDEHPAGIGDPLNVAARLQQEARDGEVLIGPTTRRLVADAVTLEQAGVFALKGRAETVTAYRVMSLERPAGAATAGFVGREEELARITAVYEAALAASAARLAVVLGSPGLGKSRLIEEVARRLGDANVVTAQCDAAGGATFAPVAEALREYLRGQREGESPDEPPSAETRAKSGSAGASPSPELRGIEATLPESPERARIIAGISALLAGSPASPEETFFVIRRLLAALAQDKPVVLVIDDLHWAEPLLLDLVEHLIQWGSGIPLFVLIGARPELRDLRSSLVTPGGLVADVLALAGLDAGAAMRLAANVIGASDLPAAVATKVLATSEGNPLFVGELVRMLVDERAIERQGDRWVVGANLAALEVPPTIHALLAARIERLRPEERTVLERAAVVGRHFSRGAVAALLGRNDSELDARLEKLRRTELIERDAGWFLGEPVLRFHHVLIRDAAYRRLLKGTRAELHERLANWIEAQAGEVAEHDETIGWHLEQAHQLLRELGPLDAAGRVLGERAAQHLSAAGRRALARDDLPVAADLLGRAINCLAADDVARADLALDWCEALLSAGDVATGAKAIEELGRFALEKGLGGYGVTGSGVSEDPTVTPNPLAPNPLRLRAWHTCFAAQLTVLTAPQALQTAADSVAAAAQQLGALGDAPGEAKAHSVHAQALARLGKVGACEAALDQALAAARRAGDRRRANAVLAGAPLAALWGPSPVTRASGRCLDVVRVLRITQGAPAVESVALSCQGVLEALRGRTEAARRMLASSRKMVQDLGIAHRLFEADAFAGRIAAMEGDAAGAERLLRSAYEGLRDLGLGIDAARAGALLARTLLAQDRVAEAESLSHESERLAGDDLQAAIAWRGVRAEALAKRGEHSTAIELAQAAVAIASATDALLDHADARMALAAALRAAGGDAEADAEERRAIELWEAKGATLLAERARRDGGHAAPGSVVAEPIAARRAVSRRMRPNAATAMQARFDAALAACDFDAIAAVFHEDHREIDHPTGSSYGRDACIASVKRLFQSRHPHYEVEPLATLGESLLLVRRRLGAAGTASARYDVGAYENEAIQLFEVDASGLCRSAEVFGVDHLGDAIARLYERYAERLADTPSPGRSGAQAVQERERAMATARSFSAPLTAPGDVDGYAAVIAPDFESVDHRHLSTWSMRGGGAFLAHNRALQEVASDVVIGTHNVLALEPGALLIQRMHSGTERLGGGAYERPFLVLFATDAAGRLTRAEWFDSDREAEALARFQVLVAGTEPKPLIRRRVRANAATRGLERFESALRARDVTALKDVFHESLQVVHQATRATYGRREMLGAWRSVIKAERFEFRSEMLASLGGALALERHFLAVEGLSDADMASVGRAEFDEIALVAADDRGRWVHCEIFAAERLRSAIIRLYERYAECLPEGPERTRASGTAWALAAFDGPLDADRIANVHASSFECVDHRTLGTWSAKGRAEWRTHWRGQADLATGWMLRDDDVLALDPVAMVLRQTFLGIGVTSGGAFENAVIAVITLDADGLITRTEVFEADQEAEALARFDELVGRNPSVSPLGDGSIEEGLPSEPFANAATQALDRGTAALGRRDWQGFAELFASDFRLSDRTAMGQIESDATQWLAAFREMIEMTSGQPIRHVLATRGERLMVARVLWRGAEGDIGPSEVEWLILIEVDEHGHHLAVVSFNPNDLDAAHAELDARYEAGEGASYPAHGALMRAYLRAIASGDWEPVLARMSGDTFVEYDHRALAVLGTTRGADAWVKNFSTLTDLAPDTTYRPEHFRSAAHGFWCVGTWHGSREGGSYELPINAVLELDEHDRLTRSDIYDPDQTDAARARFVELRQEARAPDRFGNAATATVAPVIAYMIAHDWAGFEQLFAERFRMSDRRRVVQLDLDRDRYVAFTREIADGRAILARSEIVATRGERLALTRSTFEFTDGNVGPSEVAFLLLTQVEERGRIDAYVRWDLEDLGAAYAELDAHWAAHGAAEHPRAARWLAGYLHAFAVRDWVAMTALFTPDLVGENHRLVGWGTRQGPEGVVSTLQAQIELAPDTQERVDHVRTCERAVLFEYAWHGTREGGAFENVWLVLVELAPDGRACHADVWEPEQLDQARARFAEIAARDTATAPFENVASHAWREVIAAWRQRDLERFAALQPSPLRYRDHRRLFQLDLDREGFLEFTRPLLTMRSASAALELLATRGERLALMRFTLDMEDDAVGPSAIDSLLLIETDEQSAIVSYDRYDIEDEDAARDEIWERWQSGDGSQFPAVASIRDHGALAGRRDWDAVAALYSPVIVGHDHRLVSWGTLRGRTDFLQSLRSMEALSPDARIRSDHTRACARGFISSNTWVGTRDGGAFESPFLVVSELDPDGKVVRIDFYDPHHLDRALSRFAEIGANPPADPIDALLKGHAVTTALESWRVFDKGADPDWEALHASCAPDMTFEDRQGFARLSGGREMMIASLRERVASGARAERRLLGTAGERIAVMRMLWTGGPADGRFEIEYVSLAQLDEAGLVVAIILFGPDDERAAQREAWARWAAIDPIAAPWLELVNEFTEAWNGHDQARVRTCFADDFVLEDHRHAGLGRIEGAEAYVDSIVVLWNLAPDQRIMFGWSWPAVERHGIVVTVRRQGTVPDGGPFETEHLALALARNGRFIHIEFFELDALDTVLARFAELCAAAAAETA